jgi:hypothetical protein
MEPSCLWWELCSFPFPLAGVIGCKTVVLLEKDLRIVAGHIKDDEPLRDQGLDEYLRSLLKEKYPALFEVPE